MRGVRSLAVVLFSQVSSKSGWPHTLAWPPPQKGIAHVVDVSAAEQLAAAWVQLIAISIKTKKADNSEKRRVEVEERREPIEGN